MTSCSMQPLTTRRTSNTSTALWRFVLQISLHLILTVTNDGDDDGDENHDHGGDDDFRDVHGGL